MIYYKIIKNNTCFHTKTKNTTPQKVYKNGHNDRRIRTVVWGLIPSLCDKEDAACGIIVLMHFQLRFNLLLYGGEILSLFVRQECGI